MVTLEQVEELRKYASISFNEAKAALEETDGDILEAIINLEKRGIIKGPEGGGYYSSKDASENDQKDANKEKAKEGIYDESVTSFSDTVNKFISFLKKLFKKANRNSFHVTKDGERIISVPVIILAILILCAFWITIPIMVIGLFLGYKYSFAGPDLGKEQVNRAMDSASNAAESIKKEFKGDDNIND